MITKKCPNCGTTIELDERGYDAGEVLDVNCPVCDFTTEITVPEKINVAEAPSTDLVTVNNQVAVKDSTVDLAAKHEHELKMKQMELEIEKAKAAAAAAAAVAKQAHAQMAQQQQQMQQMQQQPNTVYVQQQYQPSSGKSKATAGILAILLGGLGAHKFYLGKTGVGVLYLIFCWTYIPAVISLIEGIMYLCSSDEDFERKYCSK